MKANIRIKVGCNINSLTPHGFLNMVKSEIENKRLRHDTTDFEKGYNFAIDNLLKEFDKFTIVEGDDVK